MIDGFVMDKSYKRLSCDFLFIISLVLITSLGLATLYSSSYGYAVSLNLKPTHFVDRQCLWLLITFIIFIACSYIPLEVFCKLMSLIILVSLVLLVLPLVPGIGIERNGGKRWFGTKSISFQPSELFKPVIILYLSYMMSKNESRISDIMNAVVPPSLVALLGFGIILLQNDFSTAVMVLIFAIVMLWIAKVPIRFFLAVGSLAIPLLFLLIFTSKYRLERIIGLIAPSHDPGNISYQVNNSVQAIISGGFLGKGIGQGTLKLGSIPEVQSDFVFASYVEETGFIGVLVFFVLWGFFIYRAICISIKAKDNFRSFLAFGLSAYIAIQMIFNVMVVGGIVPATGIPLPFFSSGGSSLLSMGIASGFIVNVSRSSNLENNKKIVGAENNV